MKNKNSDISNIEDIKNDNQLPTQSNEKKPKLLPILNPVFLSLFSSKRKYNLENFLSCILKEKIKITKVLTEYSIQHSRPKEKISRLDVYATTQNNQEIIIEVQLRNPHNMPERLQFSNCVKIAKQLESGDNYSELCPVISIGLFYFEIPELKGLNTFCAEASTIFKNITPQRELTNKQRYFIIDLTKAKSLYENGSDETLVKWCMFLTNPNSLEVEEIVKENSEIKKLNEDLEEISQDELLRQEAEFWRMNSVILDWNEKSCFNAGKEEGLNEGSKKEKIEIAKNMLKKNLDINLIIELTSLTKEEIETLK